MVVSPSPNTPSGTPALDGDDLRRFITRSSVAQAVFALLFALDALTHSEFDLDLPPLIVSALGLLVLATVAAGVIDWVALPRWAPAAIALLDMAAIGVSKLDDTVAAPTSLLALPMLFLGLLLGRRGVAVGVVAALALVVTPTVLSASSGMLVIRALVGVSVSVIVAIAIALAVEQLTRSQRTLQAVVETVPVGLLLVDADGSYRPINREQERLLDLAYPDGDPDGLMYRPGSEVPLPPEDHPCARTAGGTELDDLRLLIGSDPSRRRSVSVSSRVLRSSDGTPDGGVVMSLDVTEFVRAVDVKDQFVASVSHELRTPLTAIAGYTELILEDDDVVGPSRRHLEVIGRSSARLSRLVEDLLDMAQRRDELPRLDLVPVDVRDVVRESIAAAAPAARRRHIVVSAEDGDPILVHADAGRLGQALDNLVSNAVKYTGDGGAVRVRVDLTPDAVALEVEDSGIGIAAEDVERVFDRFFRVDRTHRDLVAGAGLGLTIVRDIMAAHGGRVTVESEPDRGSTFRLVLPR